MTSNWPAAPSVGDKYKAVNGVTYEYTEDYGWQVVDKALIKNELAALGVVFLNDPQTLTEKTLEDPIFTALSLPNSEHLLDFIEANINFDVDIPGVPRNVAVEQHTKLDDDGKIDLRLKVTWNFPLGEDANSNLNYEVYIIDEDNVDHSAFSKTRTYVHNVRSNVHYRIYVRGIGRTGTPGPFSEKVTITTNKKLTTPARPTNFDAVGKQRRVKLKCDSSPDKDYKKTNVYRSFTNDFLDAEKVAEFTGDTHVDDNLYDNTNYYYWITHVDRSGNESSKTPNSNNNGEQATTLVSDTLDTSPPNPPQDLELTQRTFVDQDGAVKFEIFVDWEAPIGAATGVSYEIEISDAEDVFYRTAKLTKYKFPAKSGIPYLIKVRAISNAGIPGEWSTTETITLDPKLTAPTTPSGLVAVGKAKRVKLRWTDSPDKDYKKTVIYRSFINDFVDAEIEGSISGRVFIDDDLVPNTNYYYWIVHIDRTGNESGKHPNSNTNGVLATTESVDDGENLTPPHVPLGLNLAQQTDVDADGKVILTVKATWEAPIGSATGVNYELQIKQGSDRSNIINKDRSYRFRVKAHTLYQVRVRALSHNNVEGDWTDYVDITTTSKADAPAAPIDLIIASNHKRMKLTWPSSQDPDYNLTRVYRATSNNFTLASVSGTSKGTVLIDDDLVNKQTYYYWITFVDTTGNESAKFPTSNTDGVEATARQIRDQDVDDDPPNVPSGLWVNQRTNLDEDGKVDLKLIVHWNPPTGHSFKDTYEVWMSDGTDNWRGKTKDESYRLEVRSGITFSVKVRAVTFAGVAGDWTSVVSINVSKKATAPTTPSGLTAHPNHKRIKLKWDDIPDKDYGRTIVYRAPLNDFTVASSIGKTKTTVFLDDDLASNENYYYWIVHEDKSGNESAKHPASNTNGVHAVTKRITDEDTEEYAPFAPTGVTLTQRLDIDEDGKAELFVIVSWTAHTDYSNKDIYEVYMSDGTDNWRNNTKEEKSRFRVRSNVGYNVKVRAIRFNGMAGSWSSVVTITPNKKNVAPVIASFLSVAGNSRRNKIKWSECPEKDYKHTKIYRSPNNTWGGASVLDKIQGTVLVDDNLVPGTSYYYYISHVDSSGNESVVYPSIAGAGVMGIPGQITTADISPGSITDGLTDQTPVGTPTGLLITQLMQDVDEDGKVDIAIRVEWNPVAGAKNYGVSITQGSDAHTVMSDDAIHLIKAKSNKLYSIKVRSLSFNGSKSAYTNTIDITPSKKMTPPSAPAGVSVQPRHKGFRITWNECTNKDYSKTRVWRYSSLANATDDVSGLFVGASKGEVFNDYDANIANSTPYWYRIAHIDTSFNQTAKSSPLGATSHVLGYDDTDTTPLTAPTGLTVIQAAKDVDEDGKVDIAVISSWTALLNAKRYELEITEAGVIVDNVVTATGLKSKFKGKSNKLYSIRIRAFSFNGTPGAWSSPVTLTTTKKSDPPATPTSLTVIGGHKRNKITWSDSEDFDYKHTKIYRSPNGTWASATPIGRAKSSVFIDDDLSMNTNYYYYVSHVDTSKNESVVYPSIAGAGVLGQPGKIITADISPGAITDDLTDQTAVGIPTGLALSQANQDIDDDGKIDIAFNATWNAISGAKGYSLQITQGSDVWYVQSDDTSQLIRAKSNKLYSVKVRSLSFNGSKSGLSSAITITPSKKTAPPAAPTSFTINGGNKRNKLKWSKCTANDYKQTIIYRSPNSTWASAVEIESVKGTAFIDDNLTAGTSYYYYIAHQDTSNNLSTIYPSTAGTGVQGVPGTITGGDIPAGTILDSHTSQVAVGTPTGLTVVQATKDVDEDGKVDIALYITWNGVSGARSYSLQITQGTDVWFAHSDDTKQLIKAKSNKVYSIKVRSHTFNGTKSTLSSEVTITPTKKDMSVVAPTTLSVTSSHKRNRLRWSASIEPDYKNTKIFRCTTNEWASAILLDQVKGTAFIDDSLTIGVQYWYYVAHVDTSGNESWVYPSALGSGISGTAVAILEGDTDQNPLSIPTGLALVQLARDVDEDGKVDIAVKASWNVVTNVKSYSLEITQGTDVSYVQTDGLAYIFKAKSNKLYSVKVRSLTFNGTPSNLSSAVTITPIKKGSAPTTAAGLSVYSKVKGMRLNWTDCPDKDYKHTRIFRHTSNSFGSATLIGRSKTDGYLDTEELTVDTTYYYWIAHVDTSDNIGTQSSSVSGVYRAANDLDTNQSAAAVPTGLSLAQVAKDIDEDGKIDIAFMADWDSVAGAKSYSVQVTQGSDVWYHQSDDTRQLIRAKSNKLYSVKVRSLTFNGTKSNLSSAVTITPTKKGTPPVTAAGLSINANHKRNRLRWTECSDNDYKNTRIYRHTSNSFGGATLLDSVKGSAFIDDNIGIGVTYYYWVAHVDTSGNVGTQSSSVSSTVTPIYDVDTDQTALTAPSGLSLLQATKDVDEDGKVDIAIFASWGALTGAKSYELEVTEAGTIVDNAVASNLKKYIKAKSNKLYSIRIRALSFNGTFGAWSTAVTLTPSKKSIPPATASGLGITSKTKGMRLKWTGCDEEDYKHTLIYRNTVNTFGSATVIAKTKSDAYFDTEELTVGTLYYYWVAHVDTSNNVGAPSSSVNATYRALQAIDVDGGFIDNNLIIDGNFESGFITAWSGTGGVLTNDPSSDSPVGGRMLTFDRTVSDNSLSMNRVYVQTLPVLGGETYLAEFLIKGNAASSNGAYLRALFYDADKVALVGGSGLTYRDYYANGALTTSWVAVRSTFTLPAAAKYAKIQIIHNSTSTIRYMYVAGVKFNRVLNDDDMNPVAASVPSGLALNQLVQDVDEDGKVDIAIKVTWNAVTDARAYSVQITQGSDVWFEKSDDTSVLIKAKSNKLYSVKVRSLTFNGVKSALSSAVTITPVKKSAFPATAAGLAITPKPKGMRLDWTDCPDKDYKHTKIYRHTSNTFGSATVIARPKNDTYLDSEELTVGTTYYYWVAHVDTSDNVGTQSSSVSGVYRAANDADTNQSAAAVPTGLSVTQVAKDIDEDGKIDIAFLADWDSMAGAKSYALQITQGSDVWYVQSDDTSQLIKAKSNKLYSVKVRSLTFNGTKSSLSSAVTITPVKKSALPVTAAGLAITPKPKGMRLKWTDCSDNDYKHTRVYRNTVNTFGSATIIARPKGDAYFDTEELVVGITYYYWVAHVDTSSNVGTQSSSVSGTYRAVNDGDFTGPLSNSKLDVQDMSNLFKNSAFKNNDFDGYESSLNNFSLIPKASCPITNPPSDYIAQTSPNSTYRNLFWADQIEVSPGEIFTLRMWVAAQSVTAGNVSIGGEFRNNTDGTYSYASVVGTLSTISTNGVWTELTGIIKVPSTTGGLPVVRMRVFAQVANNATNGTVWITKLNARRAMSEDMAETAAPSAPGTPTLTSLVTDIDGDGSLDACLVATWSAPTPTITNPSAKGYEVEISNSASSGGTYVVRDVRSVVGNSVTFKANQKKFYKVRVRAISFANVAGAYSSLSTATQPDAKVNSVTLAAGLAIVAKPKGMRLTWTECPDGDYKHTRVYRHTSNVFGSATVIAKIDGTAYLDTEELTVGTTYYYWVAHVDTSGNVGAQSSSVSGVYKGTQSGDIEGQVSIDSLPADFDTTNLFKNPAFSNGNATGYYNPNGWSVVTRAVCSIAGAPAPYVAAKTPNSAYNTLWVGTNNSGADLFDVSPNEIFIGRVFGAATANCTTGVLSMSAQFDNGTSDGIYTYVTFASTNISVLASSGTWTEISGFGQVPATVNGLPTARMALFVQISNSATNGTNVFFTKPKLRRAASTDTIPDGAVTAATIGMQAVLPSKAMLGDPDNKVQDSDCIDVDEWASTLGAVTSIGTGLTDEAANRIITAASTSSGSVRMRRTMAVKPGRRYKAGGYFGWHSGAVGVDCTMYVQWFSKDAGGNETFISNTLVATSSGTGQTSALETVTAPANARRAWLLVTKSVTASDVSITLGAPIFRRAVERDHIPDGEVDDSAVDQTAPGTPTSLVVTQTAKTVDGGDGRVEIGMKASWVAPVGGITVRRYKVEITDGTDTWYVTVKNSPYKFFGVVGKTYTVKVNAESFSGVEGSQTSGVALAPTANITGGSAPTWEASNPIIDKPRGNLLRFVQPSENDFDQIIIYRNTVNNSGTATIIGRTRSNRYKDDEALSAGTTYYYWLKARNKSEAVSTSFSAVQSIVTRGTQAEDLDDQSVLAKHQVHQDRENLIPDGEFEQTSSSDITSIWDVFGGTAPTNFWMWSGNSDSGGKTLVLDNLVVGGASGGTIPQLYITTKQFIPVKPSKYLACETAIQTTDGSSTDGFYFRILWYDKNKTALASPVYTDVIANGPIPSAFTTYEDIVQAPAGAKYCKVRLYLNSNADTKFLIVDRVVLRKAKGAEITSPGSMTDEKIDQTAPGTVTSLTVAQTAKTVDTGDGSVEVGIKVTWTAPGSGVPVRRYKVTVADGTDTVYATTKQSSYKFLGVVGKTYTVSVTAESLAGVEGTAVTASGVSPTANAVAPTLPSWNASPITARPNGVLLRFDRPSEKDFEEVIVYRATTNSSGSAVEIGRSKSSRYLDQDALSIGTTYYYFLKGINRSGVSSSSFSSSQSVVFAGLSGADTNFNGFDGFVENPDFALGPNIGWNAATSLIQLDATNALGPTDYVFTRLYSGAASSQGIRNNAKFPVKARDQFTIGCMIKTSAAYVGSSLGARLSYRDSAMAEIATTALSGGAPAANTAWEDRAINVTVPATAGIVWAVLEIFVFNQTAGQFWASHPYCRPTVVDKMLDATAPGTPTGLTLTQVARNTDTGDGTVEIALKATWTAPGSGVAVKRYILEISDGTDTWYRYSRKSSEKFPFVVGKTCTINVKAESFAGVEGTATSNLTKTDVGGKTAAPADPVGFGAYDDIMCVLLSWNAPTDKDYLHTEIVLRTTLGTPADYEVDGTVTKDGQFLCSSPGVYYVYARHVNRSRVKSNWVYSGSAVTVHHAIRMASSNFGTNNSASVTNSGPGQKTFLSLTFKCTSNTAGVTVTLGSQSWTVDFVNNAPFTFTTMETGTGTFNFSKTGGGTLSGGQLSAITQS